MASPRRDADEPGSGIEDEPMQRVALRHECRPPFASPAADGDDALRVVLLADAAWRRLTRAARARHGAPPAA